MSLENLYAGLHVYGTKCSRSGPPCFHTGSTVTMTVQRGAKSTGVIFEVDNGTRREAVIPGSAPLFAFVALYNRNAQVSLVKALMT